MQELADMLFKIALPFRLVDFWIWIAIGETEMEEEKASQIIEQYLKHDLGPNRIIAADNLLKAIDGIKKIAVQDFVEGIFLAPDVVNGLKIIRHVFTLREVGDGLSGQSTAFGHQPTLDLSAHRPVS